MGFARRTTVALLFVSASIATACGGDPPPAPQPPPQPTVAETPPPPPDPTPDPTPPPPPAKPSMGDLQNRALRSLVDSFADPKAYAANFTEDALATLPGAPDSKGRAAIQTMHQSFTDSFPDAKLAFARAFQKGNVMVTEWVATGTQSKDFMGAKASSKPVGLSGASVLWFNDDGLIKEAHEYFDIGTVLGQIGASKQKVRSPATLPTGLDTHVAKGGGEEDKNVEASKSSYAALDSKKEADFLAVIDDAVEYDDMTQPAPMRGKGEATKFFGMWTKAFPDQKNTVTNSWGFEDYVVTEYNTTGTHKGPLGSLKASNKPIDLHGLDIVKMAGGKIARGRSYSNGTELMTEIGMMPKPTKQVPVPAPKK